MARQKNIFTAEGKVGQASFYKTGNKGYLIRQKGGVSAARIASDPKFANTRKNGFEFARAGVANRVLRLALASSLKIASDGSVTVRLTRELMRVVKADPTRDFGDRILLTSNLTMIKGFEFNSTSFLAAVFSKPFNAAIDRVSGHATLNIDSFVPQSVITPPPSATHYKIVASAVEIDFPDETKVSEGQADSGILPIDKTPTAALSLQAAVTPNSTLPLFMVVGIQFFLSANSFFTPLNKNLNALQLAAISV